MTTFLDVPFRDKDQAKSLGARWDASAKRWFVPAGKDLSPFRVWLPGEHLTQQPLVQNYPQPVDHSLDPGLTLDLS